MVERKATLRNNTISAKAIITVALCSLLLLCFFSALLCFESAPGEAEFGKALGLVEDGDYSQAIEILERLIPKTKNAEMNFIFTPCKAFYHWSILTIQI